MPYHTKLFAIVILMIDGCDPGTALAADSAAKNCESLLGIGIPAAAIALPTSGATVTKTVFVPATAPDQPGDYCLVDGEISPIDPRAQKIRFEVGLPTRWNGNILHLGGGGLGGQVVSPLGPELARGYVAFGSDSGHASDAPLDASFALNDEQLRNFAGDQLKKTHDAVMFLVASRYGTRPTHSYFTGGSEGGREAFAVIQRYSKDYDGVIAIAPAFSFTADFLKIQSVSRAMRLNGGAGWLSKKKTDFLRKWELDACDKLDGLEDSILANVDACTIDFAELRCPKGDDTGASCFSDAQLQSLRTLHANIKLPYTLANGWSNLPAYSIGADFSSVLEASSHVPDSIDRVFYFQVADVFVRYMVLRDSNADSLSFDPVNPRRFRSRVEDLSALLDSTGLELDSFIARGGKWILIQGRSDAGVPATSTIDYYRRVVAKYGRAKADEFLHFYLVPGWGHGTGLSFDADFGRITDSLESWVERGIAPTMLTAMDKNPEAHGRTRPLCAYPTWPRYRGHGDVDQAASFGCVEH